MQGQEAKFGYTPLPLSVQHHPFEPAASFVSRLAMRNGMETVSRFCETIGFPYAALLAGKVDAIELLAQLGGCDEVELKHASIRNLGQMRMRLRDEVLSSSTVHRSHNRVCPLCIKKDIGDTGEFWNAWRRIWWKFPSIRSCAIHQCALVTLPTDSYLPKHYDFSAQIRKHWSFIITSEVVPQARTEFEDYLEKRIAGHRGRTWIDQLDLSMTIRACEALGFRLVVGEQAKMSGFSSADWARFEDRGYRVMKRGPKAFSDARSRLFARGMVNRRTLAGVPVPHADPGAKPQ
ncbi:MAG: TniQ family protein [Maritimibacter sp.]